MDRVKKNGKQHGIFLGGGRGRKGSGMGEEKKNFTGTHKKPFLFFFLMAVTFVFVRNGRLIWLCCSSKKSVHCFNLFLFGCMGMFSPAPSFPGPHAPQKQKKTHSSSFYILLFFYWWLQPPEREGKNQGWKGKSCALFFLAALIMEKRVSSSEIVSFMPYMLCVLSGAAYKKSTL